MDAKIKLCRKKSLKVHKFSRKSTGKTSNFIERVQGIVDVSECLALGKLPIDEYILKIKYSLFHLSGLCDFSQQYIL
jgi:hypothetical protein